MKPNLQKGDLKKSSQLNAEREEDLRMVTECLDFFDSMRADEDSANSLAMATLDKAATAFEGWLPKLEENPHYFLSEKQRGWLRGVYEKLFQAPVYENLVSSGKVPRGREVPTPIVLQNLPKKPPGRSL
jgi:hypothetical protein